MKVIMGKYVIDVNENDIRKSRKTSWVSQRVKAFEWTGIDRYLTVLRDLIPKSPNSFVCYFIWRGVVSSTPL